MRTSDSKHELVQLPEYSLHGVTDTALLCFVQCCSACTLLPEKFVTIID